MDWHVSVISLITPSPKLLRREFIVPALLHLLAAYRLYSCTEIFVRRMYYVPNECKCGE